MCARFIVDRNVFFVVMPEKSPSDRNPEEPQPERDPGCLEWYENGHGLLCYTEETYAEKETRTEEKTYAEENADQMRLLRRYKEAGRAHVAAEQQMREAKDQLDGSNFKIGSDDRHILELSLATEATILCSRDKDLRYDFRNLNIDEKARQLYPVGPQRERSRSKEQAEKERIREERIKRKQTEFLVRNRCERASPASPAGA